MDPEERAAREAIVAACLEMDARGINQGTSGNVSLRWGDGLLVTPSGLPYDRMAPEDVVPLSMDGTAGGPNRPTSEWRFHRDILAARPEFGAVVHAHPVHATAIAMTRQPIPAVHYMIAAAGGPTVPVAEYATFGTARLSENVLAALEGRTACLIANHGLVACGDTLERALWLAAEIETLAHQYILARIAGAPVVLSDAEIAVNVEKFRSYGRGAPEGSDPAA